ncbi:MAG: thiol protease/hemagglutinin PrtT [Duncaniella sp.]|nr:thiol protease/hemagglutinin PrtT [Muribaculum sp.]MCM1255226.1 thiol protease/hemagglutinin PrtT [Duncaniella sp.]
MKRFLLPLLITATVAGTSFGRTLSPSEALQRTMNGGVASRVISTEIQTSPALTLSEGGMPMVYVFESINSDGYMIVSADDIAAPVLGYSDNEPFDAKNMPINLKWWLDEYKGEIAAALNAGVTAAYKPQSRASKAAIAPKVTTKWNQGEPYNDLCPSIGSSKTVTGCVATAFAQVLKYHNYPTKGKGSHTYTWQTKRLSFDFANTTFEWSKMTDTYSDASTTEQIKAVANLMYGCGVSVDMDYTLDGSAASGMMVAPALIDYFDYDKGAHVALRDLYSVTDWDDMIYTELSTNGPVFYSGQSNEGGHAFVCDGYRDGYYHFNWGWGGMSDGYFRLSALDPESQGIGGGVSGYNFGQEVVLGVKKPSASSEYSDPYMVCYGDRLSVQVSNGAIKLVGAIASCTPYTVKGKFVLEMVSASGKVTTANLSGEASLEMGMGFSTMTVAASSIPEGSSKGYIKFVSDGKSYPVFLPYSQMGYIDITKSGSSVTASIPNRYTVTANDFTLETELYINSPFKIKASLTSSSSEAVTQTIIPLLMRTENTGSVCARGEDIMIEIPAGGDASIEEICELTTISASTKLTIGDYYMCLATIESIQTVANQEVVKYAAISKPIKVSLKSNLMAPAININSWMIENASAVDPYNVVARINVTVSGIGYCTSKIGFYIFPYVAGTTVASVAYAASEPLFMSGGETKEITISCNLAESTDNVSIGGKYFGALRDLAKNDWFNTRQITFTIGESGIDDITDSTIAVSVEPNPASDYAVITAPGNITGVQIVSISGAAVTPSIDIYGNSATIDVSGLPAGMYVARISTVSGAYSAKIVKN